MIAAGLPGAGNILIFNNGAEVAEFQRGYSSVDEIAPPVDRANYRLDPDSAYGPAEPVWVYTARQGESVPLEMVQPGVGTLGNLVYRAYRHAPSYPGLQGLDLTPGEPIELYSTFSPTRTETTSESNGVENAAP